MIEGQGTQDSVYNTTLTGNHTYTITNGIDRYNNTLELKNIQLLPPSSSTGTSMITCSTSGSASNKGSINLNNVKFADASSGSCLGWISCNTTCDIYFRIYNCRMITAGTQTFTGSLLQFGGNSLVNITESYIESVVSQSNIQFDGTSKLSLTYSTIYNTNTGITGGNPTNGLVYLNSGITTDSHSIGSNQFLAGYTGPSAITIAQTGQPTIIQNNAFAVKAGSATGYAITSGTGSTLTTPYYFNNSSLPTYASNIGPQSATFIPISLTSMPNNTIGGIYTCIVGTTQTISIPGMTSTGIVLPVYVHPSTQTATYQYIKTVTPSATNGGQVVITLGQTAAITETIIWYVIRFS
jgi:hypothetical protein